MRYVVVDRAEARSAGTSPWSRPREQYGHYARSPARDTPAFHSCRPPRQLPARELLEVRDRLLRPEVRLLTVTGAGGSGKTRLALEVAALLQDAFEDGVVYVDLTEVRDPALVVSAIARSLGLWDAGGPLLFD